ncbi:low-specificity L-threonine aldolase [Hahella sp. KA22]|uniref:low-specificity L-threonine aldolase n=1 Tax=Hahella sp. KA22 TaxID=1628392 RepID=UPI000FDE693F|nr:low-specificity L-threonine aldolase [Hahella sp. KA22]AZZ90306.1 low-specificity L-threonine aldolase [Hahella sp. KA22]QAY53676.1 low-specificity L-threonine aldolase [Hahella sp. KA22]
MIDFRSDTVTRPSQTMRTAMAAAEVGDDVYGDDPTVNRLQDIAAEMLGYEAALFACSGTQTNLLALLTHCQRGDEYLVGQQAHTYKYEGGGAAVLGGIQPQPIEHDADGTIPLAKIEAAIKPDDFHFARTRLLSLENTIGGKVIPQDYIRNATDLARRRGLATHLDGARLFNATVKQGIDPKEVTQYFDSVSICLSKGLGAPVGSLLCGDKSFIDTARRWRKVCGGGMRQAGVLAAAGIIALQSGVERLQEDHDNAAYLAQRLAETDLFDIDMSLVQTNMAFATYRGDDLNALAQYLKSQNILISPSPTIRFVTHLDISRDDIDRLAQALRAFSK